jgi:hypothetical protein
MFIIESSLFVTAQSRIHLRSKIVIRTCIHTVYEYKYIHTYVHTYKQVGFTLFYRPRRESNGIALLWFLDPGTRRGQRHASAAFYPRERPGTHCTGGWVGPKAGLDRCGKSRPTGIRSPDHPARNQSLYRLSYPAYYIHVGILKIRTSSKVMCSKKQI